MVEGVERRIGLLAYIAMATETACREERKCAGDEGVSEKEKEEEEEREKERERGEGEEEGEREGYINNDNNKNNNNNYTVIALI